MGPARRQNPGHLLGGVAGRHRPHRPRTVACAAPRTPWGYAPILERRQHLMERVSAFRRAARTLR
eukprot:7349534-Lingulodinium_polyedra.AAC.1